MNETRTLMITALVIMLLSASVFAQNDRTVRFEDIRALAMGGAGITTLEGFNAVIYNPASVARAGNNLDLICVQVGVGNDILDMYDFIDENESRFDDFDNLAAEEQQDFLDDLTPWDDNWMGASAQPSIGFTTSGFAAGVYISGRVDTKIDKGVIASPRVFMKGTIDRVIVLGAATKLPASFLATLFPNDLHAGISIKLIERRTTSIQASASNTDFENALDSLKEHKKNGFGLDVGLLYDLIPGKVTAGMSVTDLLASIEDHDTHPIVNFGSSYQVGPWLFAADYRDLFFHYGGNMFNRLYLGAEYSLGKILLLRGGIAQGYPSIGAGLDFQVVKLEGAIYGFERTGTPGGDGDYNYAARLKIGF